MKMRSGLTGFLLAAGLAHAIDLDVNNTDSLISASRTIVGNILSLYRSSNNSNGDLPGLFGAPYFWWEGGLAFDSLINYWSKSKSGDDSIVQTIQDGMLFQVGPDHNYMPPNQTKSLGNDDQASWALAAMTAAENDFPERDDQNISWIQLATNVFESQVLRWDEESCGGGLKWQIFTFNNGDWARRSIEWSYQIGLINNETGAVYDGTDDTTNCSEINYIQWSMNAGLLIDAGAYMTNITQFSSLSNATFWDFTLWLTISTASRIFVDQAASANSLGRSILYEVACQPSDNCYVDQKAYRTRLARAMGNARHLAYQSSHSVNGTGVNAYIERITSILQTSATAAASQCTGGEIGTACGSDWVSREFDGSTGLGEDLSALEVILANLPAGQVRTADGARNGTGTSESGTENGTQTSSADEAGSTSGTVLESTTPLFHQTYKSNHHDLPYRTMTDNWGTRGTGTFVPTSHASPYDAINPSAIKLPKPYVVCIVGASRGIGAGVAHSYAQAGCSGLVLASRRTSGLEEVAAECRKIDSSIEVEIVACDITSAECVASLAEGIKERFGRLDIAVVNSGYSGPVVLKITETDPSTFQNATNVNYVGTFLCAKYLIPLLLSTPDGAKAFIGVNSLASLIIRGPIANAQYCVSKAAQLKLLENIHEQYQDEGLSTYAVHPGAVLSEMADETTPDAFRPYLTDSPLLCGAFCVWLTKYRERGENGWLAGRLLSAKWDVSELLKRKEEIVQKDLLKLRLSL
ncbi:Mannan endo-1,6-alpha-mannosidase DCW1 [Fulvia fulva]|nr:Mannan endo-1,6-alpha-mannosidase DCW1 [Fulvia fulva]